MPESIRIIIADDHAILRESLAALLGSQPDMQVIAKTGTGAESIQAAREQRPDVLLLDLFMPGGDGFEVLRALDRSGTGVATVVLTASENQNDYVQVVQLGARGLVLKADQPDKLFTAIRMVANGELAFSEDIAQQVLSAMAGKPQKDQTAMRRLSDREKQIAALVARGMKNKDIAAELKISENTVKRHLQSIFSKTGARDRLELAVLALTEFTRAA
jgi:DNA-binding NarL/FixJ family response regulator